MIKKNNLNNVDGLPILVIDYTNFKEYLKRIWWNQFCSIVAKF
jgi:hypothetical protein